MSVTRSRTSPSSRSAITRCSAKAWSSSSMTSARCASVSTQRSSPGWSIGASTRRKLPPAVVGEDVEALPAVLDAVLVFLPAWRHDPPGILRTIGGHEANLARGVAGAVQEQVRAAARAMNADLEALVALLVDDRIDRLAEAMTVETVLALGGILDRVEEGPAIARPRHRAHVVGAVQEVSPGHEIADVEIVDPKAHGIRGVGEQ